MVALQVLKAEVLLRILRCVSQRCPNVQKMEDAPNVWQLLGKIVINRWFNSFFLPKFQTEISVVTYNWLVFVIFSGPLTCNYETENWCYNVGDHFCRRWESSQEIVLIHWEVWKKPLLVDDSEELYHVIPPNRWNIETSLSNNIVDARNGSIHWEIYCGNPHSLFIGHIKWPHFQIHRQNTMGIFWTFNLNPNI
jgi:hypothetical protein